MSEKSSPCFDVDFVHSHRGLHMVQLVGRPLGVREEERIELHQHGASEANLFIHVVNEAAPGIHLLDIQPEKVQEVGVGKFEESPLVAFEVDTEGERQRRQRFEAQSVEQFDEHVDITIRLGPRPSLAVTEVTLVGGRVQTADRAGHNASTLRTSEGHRSGSIPWVRKSASAIRSRPKPTQAL